MGKVKTLRQRATATTKPKTDSHRPAAAAAPAPQTNSKLIQKSKGNKLKEKRENLLRKINVNQKAKVKISKKKEVKQSKKKEKKKVAEILTAAADFSALKNALQNLDDSLPSLTSLFQLRAKKKQEEQNKKDSAADDDKKKADADGAQIKLRKSTKTKLKKNEFMKRYKYLEMLTNDKTFKKNPREVIAMHIRNNNMNK